MQKRASAGDHKPHFMISERAQSAQWHRQCQEVGNTVHSPIWSAGVPNSALIDEARPVGGLRTGHVVALYAAASRKAQDLARAPHSASSGNPPVKVEIIFCRWVGSSGLATGAPMGLVRIAGRRGGMCGLCHICTQIPRGGPWPPGPL